MKIGLLKTRELAAYLGFSPQTVSRWAREGRIPYVWAGRYLFDREAVEEELRTWTQRRASHG